MTAIHVTAIVVTFNRAALLGQVLAALAAQTRPPDDILVIDNASTDGTAALLAANPAVTHIRLERNTGSSGGFSAGIARGLAGPATHLWIMDDDAIPAPDALARLLYVLHVSGKAVAAPRRQYAPALVTPAAVAAGQIAADGVLRREHVLDDAAEAFRPPGPLQQKEGAAWHAVDVFTFEGPLATRAAAEAGGPPDPGLFISADDTLFSVGIARALGPLAAALVPAAVMEKQLPPPAEAVGAAGLDAPPLRPRRHRPLARRRALETRLLPPQPPPRLAGARVEAPPGAPARAPRRLLRRRRRGVGAARVELAGAAGAEPPGAPARRAGQNGRLRGPVGLAGADRAQTRRVERCLSAERVAKACA